MPTEPSKHCPYFEVKQVSIPLPVGKASLSLTVPYCHLARIMGERMDTLPGAREAIKLLVTTPVKGVTRFIYGPDMENIAEKICTPERLPGRCGPAFVALLTNLGLDATLPKADFP